MKSNCPKPEKINNLFIWLTLLTPLFKPNHHKNDREWRIITMEIYDPEGQLVFPACLKRIDFLPSDIIFN